MKTFTKVMLILSGIFATIGVVCIVIACSMGVTWGTFETLLKEGNFSISIENGFFGIHFNNDNEISNETYYVSEEIVYLNVEYGAGELEIVYGDVEQIQIETRDVINFSMEVEGKNLEVSGDLGVNNGDSSLKIILPKDTQLETLDLEVGASVAKITDLIVDVLNVEVGTGQATLKNIDLKSLDAEVGVGELDVELVGSKKDYSYSVECGIGSIRVGDKNYGGFGSSNTVEIEGVERILIMECGIGEIIVTFME